MSTIGWISVLMALLLCVGQCVAATIADVDSDLRKVDIDRIVDAKLMKLYAKNQFKPNAPLLEKDCTSAICALALAIPGAPKPDFATKSPDNPVPRVRALVAIVKCLISKQEIDSMQDTSMWLGGFSDAAEIPKWAVNHTAYGVSHNLVPSEDKLRPNQPMTRSEFAWLLSRALPKPAAANGCTGLLIDCGSLPLQRCMAPTLLDEDGNTIYPDEKNLPTIEFMEDQGMASFVSDPAKSTRTGERALTVKALRLDPSKRDTVIVSSEDAKKILEEEKQGGFLAKWSVTFVVAGTKSAATEDAKDAAPVE